MPTDTIIQHTAMTWLLVGIPLLGVALYVLLPQIVRGLRGRDPFTAHERRLRGLAPLGDDDWNVRR